tara:strand:- start:2373 stop:3206 length:834 start_codon:yes stop_codon:yes gene_type:complete
MTDYTKRLGLLAFSLTAMGSLLLIDVDVDMIEARSQGPELQGSLQTLFIETFVEPETKERGSSEVKEIPPPDDNDDISLKEESDIRLSLEVENHADGPLHTLINWDEILLHVLTTEYVFGEVSPEVRTLQYFIGVNIDGEYGPVTYYAHNKALYPFFGTLVSGNYLPTWSSYGATFIDDVERWRSISLEALSLYGQEHQIDRFLRVMQCESRGLPEAFNESSGASGLMQHLANYWPWRAKMAGFEGVSPFDATANIYTSAWLLFEHSAGGWQHWECK